MTPGTQRNIDRLSDTPVGVFSAAWDLVTWNPLWAALQGDPSSLSGPELNLVWSAFMGNHSRVMHDDDARSAFERDIVADLRSASGRYPSDRALRALIAELVASSARFRAIWAEAQVAHHLSGETTIETPAIGPITLDCDILTAPGSDLRVVVYTAEPGTRDAAGLDLLLMLAFRLFPPSPRHSARRTDIRFTLTAQSSSHRRMSPGWQSSTRQIASRVENRMARARPFLSTATFAGVIPMAAANSPTPIPRSTRSRSMRM